MTGHINIAGALHSIDDTGIVVYTGDVFDDRINDTLFNINRNIENQILSINTGNTVISDDVDQLKQTTQQLSNTQQQLSNRITELENRPSGGGGSGSDAPCGCKDPVLLSENEFNELTLDKTDFSMLEHGVLYMTYNDDPDEPTPPTPPTPQGDTRLELQTLITSFVINNLMLETTGILENNTLTFN